MTTQLRDEATREVRHRGLDRYVTGRDLTGLSDSQLQQLAEVEDEPWDGGGYAYGRIPDPPDEEALAEHARCSG